MKFIVLGAVRSRTTARARLVALKRYLERKAGNNAATVDLELWASHPRYCMVFSVTATVRQDVVKLLSPWADVAKFDILDVEPMRPAVQRHLATHEVAMSADLLVVDVDVVAPSNSPTMSGSVISHTPSPTEVPPLPTLPPKLLAILSTTQYDLAWPEDSYTGDYKLAYDQIVSQLPSAPKLGLLPSDALASVTRPSNPSAEWLAVFDHLAKEIGYFQVSEAWFANPGHVQAFISEVSLTNANTITALEQQTQVMQQIGLQSSLSITLVLHILLGLLAIAAAATGNPILGGVLGFFAANVGDFSGPGGGSDEIPTTFANAAEDVNAFFNQMITMVEKWNIAISNNWGKRSTFGMMVEQGELVWPADTSPQRDAASVAFETYLWHQVFPLLSKSTFLARWFEPRLMVTPATNPWNPEGASDQYNSNFYYRTSAPATWTSGGCPSSTVNGYMWIDHAFGMCVNAMEQDFYTLPRDFLYHLFGSNPLNGRPSLAIDPADFYASTLDVPTLGSWSGISLFQVGTQPWPSGTGGELPGAQLTSSMSTKSGPAAPQNQARSSLVRSRLDGGEIIEVRDGKD